MPAALPGGFTLWAPVSSDRLRQDPDDKWTMTKSYSKTPIHPGPPSYFCFIKCQECDQAEVEARPTESIGDGHWQRRRLLL